MIPYLTEKTLRLVGQGVYTFLCPKNIEKISIAKEIEKFYNVSIESIQTIKKPPAVRRVNRKVGFGPVVKKVLVTLKKGQKIPGFEVSTTDENKKRGVKEK